MSSSSSSAAASKDGNVSVLRDAYESRIRSSSTTKSSKTSSALISMRCVSVNRTDFGQRAVVVAALLTCLTAMPAAAQKGEVGTGGIKGVVRDSSGTAVEGAKPLVEIISDQKGGEIKHDRTGENDFAT